MFQRILKRLLYVTLAISSMAAIGCSPSPSSEELIKTAAPNFDGADSFSATTSTTSFVLMGNCDQKSYGLEYSFDGSIWTTLVNDCSTGRFTMQLIVRRVVNVQIRAKTKMGYTASAKATVRFALAPTSASFEVVSAGNAVDGEDKKLQFTSSTGAATGHYSSPTMNLQTGVTGVTYHGL